MQKIINLNILNDTCPTPKQKALTVKCDLWSLCSNLRDVDNTFLHELVVFDV